MSGWHPAYESSSGHPPASASGGFAASDEQPENLFGADADDWAFLRDEESLPYSEAKFKDALIFLIDCSALMQFPANEDDLDDESSNRIKVKPEASSIDSASGHHAASHETSSGGAAAASSSAGSSDGARRPAAAAASSRDPSAPQMTQFQMVLSVVLHSIRNKIISTPDDFVGLVFFGSRESQNPNGFPHIYIHTPLQNLTAGAIRKMDALMDQDEFDAMIGSLTEDQVLKGGKVEMDKILWICSSMFTEAAAANCHKRIIVLTNNDTPFNTQDRQSKMRAIQKGKDLRDLDIAIDLIAVAKKPDEVTGSPKVFNPLLFFSDIYIFDSDESPDQLAAVFRSKMSDLKEQLFKKSMKKRSLGSVPLQLGAGVQLGVKLYCMIRETKKESAVYLDSETNEKLDVQTRFLDASTGAVLQTHEMQKSVHTHTFNTVALLPRLNDC
jgi:hypothetical protein